MPSIYIDTNFLLNKIQRQYSLNKCFDVENLVKKKLFRGHN